ncbi:MAG: ATP-binding cassette domain-containing protein, partial [Desulfovibrionaceae bacterium]|nr:ATP-binding cassette domain-containing protein [Desulfovibrionaceae bacterium]
MNLLLELEHINLSLGGAKILSDISWQVHEQESWAVLGPNGSGKSTLLRLALGELRPDQNFDETGETSRQIWHIAGKPEISPIAVKQVVSLVSPELHNWYWEHGWQLSGEELLLTGLYASPLLYTSPLPEELAEVRALAEELELEHLLDYTVSEMSQGQLRRMLVARALIGRPLLLALDEVFEGLDSRARRQLTALLSELARYQTTILLTSHRTEDLPAFIRHALLLEDGKIVWQGGIMSLPEKPASGSCCTESFSSRL